MIRSCLLSLVYAVSLASLSGCCVWCPLFCHSCGSYYDRIGRGPGAHVGGCGAYGSCVTPAGCPGCSTGIYAAQIDPVQRARSQRLERARRQRYASAGARRAGCRPGGIGYGADLLDPYGLDGWLDDEGLMYGDDGFQSAYFGIDSHPMQFASAGGAPCNCGPQHPQSFHGGMTVGDWESQGWTASEWVEVDPRSPRFHGGSPEPVPVPFSTPYAPVPAPATQPMDPATPNPMPAADVTRDQYYLPGVLPAGHPTTGQRSVSPGGSPVQPVLWVPPGL